MDLRLTNTVVLITGAASGIGEACARAFAQEGAAVALIDWNERGAELATELSAAGHRALFVRTEISEERDVINAVATTVAEWGRLDAIVSCAGISGPFGTIVDHLELADWNRVLAVNVTGPFLTVKHAAKHLRLAPAPTVVLLASDSSFVAAPGMVPYNASKGAVLQLTRALSVDLAADGIRVNCVCPSIVDTPLARADLGVTDFSEAAFPVQTAAEVAQHVLYLSSPVSRPVNGQSVVSDFGYLARSAFPA